jgi:hypothetical protein
MSGKLLVYYEPNGAHARSDGEMEAHLNERIDIVNNTEQIIVVFTSNFLYIEEVRMAICQGRISHELVEFHFEDHIINSTKEGRLDEWPKGFGDRTEEILCAILCYHKE